MGVNSCGTTLIDQAVFKNIGAITWDTTVKTSGFTAVSGNGYFCNTTSAAFTVTLPSSPSAGDVVAIADYANTFDTNNVTIARNGSNIQGEAEDFTAEIEGLSITLIYVDGTQGWLSIDAAQASDIAIPPAFITATGGTITTSGNFKIHTFTSPGTFCVSQIGNAPAAPTGGPSNVDYLVVAGGGGGAGANTGNTGAGGGGAGGYRESSGVASGCYSASPLGACVSALSISATGYPITVGSGGTGVGQPGLAPNGSNSIFSTITSAGGGGSGSKNLQSSTGGSGAGGTGNSYPSGAAGNTPPTSPPQGQPGGSDGGTDNGGGGGGAGATGGNASSPAGGNGGNGVTTSINASSVTRAGGGGGGAYQGCGGTGGSGGGGAGSRGIAATNGTVNTGGGGGGAGSFCGQPPASGGNGGSGIVIIRYKFQ